MRPRLRFSLSSWPFLWLFLPLLLTSSPSRYFLVQAQIHLVDPWAPPPPGEKIPDMIAEFQDTITFRWEGGGNFLMLDPSGICNGKGTELLATSSPYTYTVKFEDLGKTLVFSNTVIGCEKNQILRVKIQECSLCTRAPTVSPPGSGAATIMAYTYTRTTTKASMFWRTSSVGLATAVAVTCLAIVDLLLG